MPVLFTILAALVAVGAGLFIGVCVGRELEERRAVAAAALSAAAHAERAKDELLAGVSHNLRTPLNAIVGWVHLLAAGTLSEVDKARALEAIARNARVETRLVSQLLDEARFRRRPTRAPSSARTHDEQHDAADQHQAPGDR